MKKVLTLLLFLLLSVTSIFAQVNLKNGLVACYPFNSNANDESGNNNNGTINGATLTTDRFGKANSAYNFNGSSDFIDVSPNQLQNSTFSYSVWIKPNLLPQDGVAFFIFSVGGGGLLDQGITLNNGYTNGTDGFTGGGYLDIGENAFCQKGSLPNVNQWYHVVVVRNTNNYTVYLDGAFMCVTQNVTKPPFYGNGIVKATIGCRQNLQYFFTGTLDDIHLYNRPLNADEVKALYNGNPTQPITISSSNPAPCGGDKITFTANGATNTSKFQWKVDGVNQGTNSKIFDYTSVKKTGDYPVKITVEVTDEDVCFPQKPVTVDKNITFKNYPIPNITLSVSNSAPCGGDKISLTANGTTNISNYQWKVDGVNQGTNSNLFDYFSVKKTGDFTVKISLDVSNYDLCSASSLITAIQNLTIKDCSIPVVNTGNKILIPNAFSPNGDGLNDTWEIFALNGNPDVIVEIYNRWGELIFYSKGYSEPWNGTYKDKPVLEGTYAYAVRIDNDTILRGTILVVR
jgi:gliding motility-associated-like protein